MSFQPVIPISGLAGWALLNRTKARQEASFNATPRLARDEAHLRATLPKLRSVQDLVEDRRLLRVALGAFGLQDDLDNRAFIRKIVEDGTTERGALANRLADKRYLAFARAFEYLTRPSATPPERQVDQILSQYRTREFEIAIGTQDQTLRLAMSLQRELPQLAENYSSDSARWFALLGNPPLREVLQTSLGLPVEFGKLDIDTQVMRMRRAAEKRFGTSDIQQLSQPDALSALTRRFLVMAQLRETQISLSWAATALVLLQDARR
jgi:hypothetical protein